MAGQTLEVIFKLSERCNIDCTYCYYFNYGGSHFERRPAFVEAETVAGLCRFAEDAFARERISHLQVDFHGGEPLLLGKRRFASLCETMYGTIGKDRLTTCLQTNAMLVDAGWIDLFERFDIKICTSLDGPEPVHDLFRRDKRKRGTYERTLQGIKLLHGAAEQGRIHPVSCLVVMNPDFPPETIYRHIVHDLGFRAVDFLLPDCTHDSKPENIDKYRDYLLTLFDYWTAEDDPAVQFRLLRSVLSILMRGRTYLAGFGSGFPFAMTVGTNGEVDTDDYLRPCGEEMVTLRQNIKTCTFEDVFEHPQVTWLQAQMKNIPKACLGCTFEKACRGGQLTHRYADENGFDNASIYCDALYAVFERGLEYLVKNNIEIHADLLQ